jgi:hypothetical protein
MGEPAQDMVETIRTLDDIFIRLAENQPLRQWVLMRALFDELDELPLDHVVEEMWTALALGYIRLTGAGRRLHVAPFVGTKAERQRLARRTSRSSRRGGGCCAACTSRKVPACTADRESGRPRE